MIVLETGLQTFRQAGEVGGINRRVIAILEGPMKLPH